MLAKAGIDQEEFDALHHESETAIQTRIAQQMAEADAQSAAMRETVRREVENWRYTVEQLKTLTATAEPIQRFLLDTASDITATPGLSLDSTQIAPGNNSAKFFLRSVEEAREEAVSFGFTWQNTSDRSVVVNVDGYLVIDGRCQAIAYGGGIPLFDLRTVLMTVDARLSLQELWNQPPTSPIFQSGQDAHALTVRAHSAGFFGPTDIVTRYLFRGFTLQYRPFLVPPHGTARFEVSCARGSVSWNGEARFIFRKDERVMSPGVLIGVLP
jgi:hypothetical protein